MAEKHQSPSGILCCSSQNSSAQNVGSFTACHFEHDYSPELLAFVYSDDDLFLRIVGPLMGTSNAKGDFQAVGTFIFICFFPEKVTFSLKCACRIEAALVLEGAYGHTFPHDSHLSP